MALVLLTAVGFLIWAVRNALGLRKVSIITNDVMKRCALSFVLTVGSFAAVGVILNIMNMPNGHGFWG